MLICRGVRQMLRLDEFLLNYFKPDRVGISSFKTISSGLISEHRDENSVESKFPFSDPNILVIVTGASGHLGSCLLQALENEKCGLRAFIYEKEIPEYLKYSRAEFFHGDIRKKDELEQVFSNLEEFNSIYFYHLASKISIQDDEDSDVYTVNVDGTKNVISLCTQYGVKRLIYVSSVHAIPEGENKHTIRELEKSEQFIPAEVTGSYAKSKSIASRAIMEANNDKLETVILHPSGIIGPGDYLIGYTSSLFLAFLKRQIRQTVRGGYDFIDVRDVVSCLLKSAYMARAGETYIVSNQYVEIRDILNILAEYSGLKKIKHYTPMWLARLFCPLLIWIYKLRKMKPLYTKYSLYTLQANSSFSHSKASEVLAFAPRPIAETIRDTMQFLLKIKGDNIKIMKHLKKKTRRKGRRYKK